MASLGGPDQEAERPWRSPERPISVRGLALIGVAALLLLAVGVAWVAAGGAPPDRNTANEMLDSWLAAMAEPDGDRGWSWLSSEAQIR